MDKFCINIYVNNVYDARYDYKYPDNIEEGSGYKVNETVVVIVDRNTKTIRWMVNGEQRATSTK